MNNNNIKHEDDLEQAFGQTPTKDEVEECINEIQALFFPVLTRCKGNSDRSVDLVGQSICAIMGSFLGYLEKVEGITPDGAKRIAVYLMEKLLGDVRKVDVHEDNE